ncbi:MAG: histidine kinase dimerization/phosphoacceptor domain -containing protein [bacterium]|nr:histidine kinase dimerization/phosphoacceptor domain -containing protein [bacterium]
MKKNVFEHTPDLFRFFRNLSIKRKLTLIDLLTTTIALCVACTAFIVYERISFRRTVLRELTVTSEIIGRNSTAALAFDDGRTAEEILSALLAQKHIVSACIYKPDGQVFATYLRENAKPEFPPAPAADRHVFTGDHLILTRPVLLEQDRIGTVYIKYDLQEMHARFRRYALIALVMILASSMISFSVASRLQQMIARPIQNLAEVAFTVSLKNDYSIRVEKKSRDEVGQLIDGFNEMLSQIQERDHALTRAQETLEKRVQERTQELMQEIFERIRVENRLRESLQEKEVLLKEIHHRVKNNLQVISSLLYLQSRKIRDTGALDMFVESQNRIRSMALIHEKLYQSEDMVHVDFSEYTRNLIGHLANSYGTQLKKVRIDTRFENVMLSIDKGIPCALIVNELVTNALKYAFPDDRTGTIRIDCAKGADNSVALTVADDGVGLGESFDLHRSETLGMQLIRSLTQQLKGRIDVGGGCGGPAGAAGARFTITFNA